MSNHSVVLLTNKAYIEKTRHTLSQLRTNGQYLDDVVIVIGNDLKNEIQNYNLENENTFIKYFPDFDRTEILEILKTKPLGYGMEINKVFQWHKLHIFDSYFKRWSKCLYIDVGMYIFKPINKIIKLNCDWKLLANSDAYPTYNWRLHSQFNSQHFPELYDELSNRFNLDIDYFQSSLMLYDTNIIEKNTKNELIELSYQYINSITNDQGILNLYFTCIKHLWKQIQLLDADTYYYDFHERYNLRWHDYIMIKYPQWENCVYRTNNSEIEKTLSIK